jgi:hypothetical protein
VEFIHNLFTLTIAAVSRVPPDHDRVTIEDPNPHHFRNVVQVLFSSGESGWERKFMKNEISAKPQSSA